jgi:RNA polymerase-interacting CarD/CdnL/TRCF family regulator
MTLTVGEKVFYPSHGPCLIVSVVKKTADDRTISFFHLSLLDGSGGEFFVPVDKAQTIGIRLLMERSEIPRLLSQLNKSEATTKDWKQRANDNLKLLSSGSPFDLAEVVESLTKLSEKKALSHRESQTLEKARKLLVCEISEVLGETRKAVEEQLDNALKG